MHVTPQHTPSKKLTILLCITKANWGGAQRYVFDLAVAAKDAGHTVAVAFGEPGLLEERLAEAHIRTIPLPTLRNKASLRALIDTEQILEALFKEEQPDVVHLNSSLVSVAGALAARRAHVPRTLFTAHGWAFNEPRFKWRAPFLKLLYWLTMLLCQKTITVSEAMRKQVRYFPFVQKNISVIHNGVASNQALSKEEALAYLSLSNPALQAQLLKHPLIIGTVAELHPIKGLTYLIEAAAMLRDTKEPCIVLVLGEGSARHALEAQIKAQHLEEQVFLLGHVAHAYKYLSAFDIFTLPSLSEGLAYVILEAGLASLPVVASRVGGIPEIITNDTSAVGMLVPSQNPEALADALLTLMHDTTLRTHIGEALHVRVTNFFSLSRMLTETLALYYKS